MSVRLDTFQTLGRNLKDCCRQTVPLICLARFLSDRPVDWFFFWIGWRFLSSSSSFLSSKNYFREARVVDHRNHGQNTEQCCFQKENDAAVAIAHRTSTARQSKHASATKITTHNASLLTSLPSVVLSNVGCYLHARDLLALDTAIRSGTRTSTRTSSTHTSADGSNSGNERKTRRMHVHDEAILHDVWKLLWYRDYGDALLQWKVAREAFRQSLVRATLSSRSTEFIENNNKHDDDDDDDDDKWVEEQLSIRLDEMTKMLLSNTTMRDFYFVFGECYVDYLLARKNTEDECYLGLHGHIFDFTDFAEYHPGLIEPILKECGGDATFFFEDLPHSSGARNIAKRLCVLVNHGAINYGNDCCSRSCGLEMVRGEDDNDSSELKRILRSSNTRPPPPVVVAHSGNNKNKKVNRNNDDRNRWMPHILPRRRQRRRHPTLEKIRTRFQQEQTQQQHQQAFATTSSRPTTNYSKFWKLQQKQSVPNASSKSRVYYDPLLQKWVRWNP